MESASERQIKLLVVDDETGFLEALGERLEMRDFAVTALTSGAEALERCRTEKFDLALVDLKMPGMNGQELLSRLKADHRYLEVIILTGHGSFGSAVECSKLGAFNYLPKPYQFDDLLRVLKDAYAERLKKKFAADLERAEKLGEIAREDSPRRILRRMKELDDDNR